MFRNDASVELLERLDRVSESLLNGKDQFLHTTTEIHRALVEGNAAAGFDLDGTLVHATPGDHVNVVHDPVLQNLLNDGSVATGGNCFVLTGRPHEFVRRLFDNRQFIAGTQHGAVISLSSDDTPKNRIGSVDVIKRLHAAFEQAIKVNPLLEGVQIEDHKTVTMTLGFTHIINPTGASEITREMTDKMKRISAEIIKIAEKILDEFPSSLNDDNLMTVVDTVTPTNAVIEIMPKGACKSASLDYLRNNGLLSRNFTIFAGDSGGDKKVMDKVRKEEGICLGVGPKAPESSHIVFQRPEHLRAYLSVFIDHPAVKQRFLDQRLG